MSISEIKAAARMQLKKNIFGNRWMTALLTYIVYSLVVSAASTLVPGIGAIIISGPMLFGLSYVFLKQARDGEDMEIGKLFCGFNADFGGNILLQFLIELFVFLWSLLLIIPGIVMAYAYSMAMYIKVDHPEYDWRQCIKGSKEMMKGHKWKLFVLDLSFIGWFIVCLFTFGIGFLWLQPYMFAAKTQFYESIKPAEALPENPEYSADSYETPADDFAEDTEDKSDMSDLMDAMRPISDENKED